ncbi:transposable element Tcb2 transposase [Trichonephila clavipes]|uniref:Transposable element Tcb2 transposase n=1 Tax=Trichonephila clavipes TaxID=2585209 RepID=A0A8X6SLC3_TRICX|nr:transposable element Tcb2 transposase [Trichonephila clavipes]
MDRRNRLDDFTRGRMIRKLEKGRSDTSVAVDFGINKSVVSRAWKAFQTTGTSVRKVGGGRLRTTTARDDRYIILQAKTDRHELASAIAQQLCIATERQVSQFTVARLFHTGALIAPRPERCLPLKIGTRFYPINIKERHRYGGSGVLVRGGIMLNGRTKLHIFDRGSVTGDRYCEEVFLPHVRLLRGAIGSDFLFMDDNARPHWTLAVEELLESENIT